MSATDFVPATRSLAAVLRDSFSTDDDACRLIVATSGPPYTDGTPDSYSSIRVVINGQTIKVPMLTGTGIRMIAAGKPVYLLSTRTLLVAIGQVVDTA